MSTSALSPRTSAFDPPPLHDVSATVDGFRLAERPGEREVRHSVAHPHRRVAIIPAYNEDRYIASVVLKTRRYVKCVVVVDDGSTDLTGALAQDAGAVVLTQSPNQGKGAAILTGLLWARDSGAETVVLLDGDSQHDPHDISRLIAPVISGEADIVVGSRFIGQEALKNVPGWRVAGQQALNKATALTSRHTLTDSQSGFRVFSRRAVEIMCHELTSKGFSVESEMQFVAREHNLHTVEEPIVVGYDVALKRNPVIQGIEVLNGLLRMVGQARPLLFISGPGLLLMALGMLLGLWVVDTYGQTQELAIGYSLLTVMLLIIGVLSVFAGITLHTMRAFFIQLTRRQ